MWNFQRITKMFFISRGIENVAILIENGFERGSLKTLDYKDRSYDSFFVYCWKTTMVLLPKNNDHLRWRFVYC